MNDSTVIMSLLESYLNDKTVSLEKLLSYYPTIEKPTVGSKKKTKEVPHKNHLMFPEYLEDKKTPEERA